LMERKGKGKGKGGGGMIGGALFTIEGRKE